MDCQGNPWKNQKARRTRKGGKNYPPLFVLRSSGLLGVFLQTLPWFPRESIKLSMPQGPHEALKSLLRPTWAQEPLFKGLSGLGCKMRWFSGLSRKPREESEGQEDHEGKKKLHPCLFKGPLVPLGPSSWLLPGFLDNPSNFQYP